MDISDRAGQKSQRKRVNLENWIIKVLRGLFWAEERWKYKDCEKEMGLLCSRGLFAMNERKTSRKLGQAMVMVKLQLLVQSGMLAVLVNGFTGIEWGSFASSMGSCALWLLTVYLRLTSYKPKLFTTLFYIKFAELI